MTKQLKVLNNFEVHTAKLKFHFCLRGIGSFQSVDYQSACCSWQSKSEQV